MPPRTDDVRVLFNVLVPVLCRLPDPTLGASVGERAASSGVQTCAVVFSVPLPDLARMLVDCMHCGVALAEPVRGEVQTALMAFGVQFAYHRVWAEVCGRSGTPPHDGVIRRLARSVGVADLLHQDTTGYGSVAAFVAQIDGFMLYYAVQRKVADVRDRAAVAHACKFFASADVAGAADTTASTGSDSDSGSDGDVGDEETDTFVPGKGITATTKLREVHRKLKAPVVLEGLLANQRLAKIAKGVCDRDPCQ